MCVCVCVCKDYKTLNMRLRLGICYENVFSMTRRHIKEDTEGISVEIELNVIGMELNVFQQ